LEFQPELGVGFEFSRIYSRKYFENLVEQDQPALLLLQIKLVPLFFLVKSQNGQIVIRPYLDVLQILLIRQKHLRSDMVQKRSFSFEQFDDL
jgi:hypothetical protein